MSLSDPESEDIGDSKLGSEASTEFSTTDFEQTLDRIINVSAQTNNETPRDETDVSSENIADEGNQNVNTNPDQPQEDTTTDAPELVVLHPDHVSILTTEICPTLATYEKVSRCADKNAERAYF